MILIGLYCFAALSLILKIGPLTIVGAFFIICYLPGLFIIAILKRDKLFFEDLILAFPCSIGISSILIPGLLFAGFTLDYIPFIMLGGVGILAVYLIIENRHGKFTGIEINTTEILFCLFALSLTLFFSIPFLTGVNRAGISGHAFHHSLLVSQIMNGIFPPENPGLGGTNIGYYWGFHALIAALTVKTDFHQIQIIFILNALSLFIIYCISYSLIKEFDFSVMYRYLLPLAITGLMRIDAGIIFLIKLISDNLPSLSSLTASPLEPYQVLNHWIQGLSWIDTRLFFLHKLYNVSGMLLALSLCYAYLMILIKNQFDIKKTDMISIALIISACFMNYPPLAIFLLFHAPLWSCYVFFSSSSNLKEKIGNTSRIILPYISAGLIVAPYMLYVMASRNVSSSGQGDILGFDFYSQSLKNMVVFMVPIPIIVYGFWIALKRLYLSNEFYFLLISSAACLFLTVFTRWPFDNSYKYNYVLVLFFSIYFLFALSSLSTTLKSKWLQSAFATVIVLSLLFSPLLVESSHIVSALSTDYVYTFSEQHIEYAQDKQRNEAYAWIRKNTPGNSLLMLSYIETNWPCCAFNNNYESAAIAERALFVIKDQSYTTSNPEYPKRVMFREKVLNDTKDPSVIEYFSTLNRPVYLLVEDKLDEKKYYVEEKFDKFLFYPAKDILLVFQNDKQRVYQILLK